MPVPAKACATNPVPIVVGCDRAVHDDGFVGGYTGGELIGHSLRTLEKTS